MSNTIRSVLFSSPLNFNHTLNRMNFFGAILLIGLTLAVLMVGVGLTEDFTALVILLLAMIGLLIVQCKVMYARFCEFEANKARAISAIIAVQALSLVGEFAGSPEIILVGKFIGGIVFLFLLFKPASKPEGTVVVA